MYSLLNQSDYCDNDWRESPSDYYDWYENPKPKRYSAITTTTSSKP